MKRKEALEKLTAMCESVTAHQTNENIMVWHDDGSVFQFSCCVYETDQDYLYVVPEHHEPCLFHLTEIEWMTHPLWS